MQNINKTKIEEWKNISNFLIEAHDENQFWHRYKKSTRKKE